MEPIKNKSSIVDLLDRILDKGVIINADILIHVAGIPLIAVSLRAAIAGIETMLEYGMMEAWDESIRNYYADPKREKKDRVAVASNQKENSQSSSTFSAPRNCPKAHRIF